MFLFVCFKDVQQENIIFEGDPIILQDVPTPDHPQPKAADSTIDLERDAGPVKQRECDSEDTLCRCTKFTASDVSLMVLTLGLRHNLSWAAQIDILKMVKLLFDNDSVPSSRHLYYNYIFPQHKKNYKHGKNEIDKIETECHLFCASCQVLLGKRDLSTNLGKQINSAPKELKCKCGETTMTSSAPYFVSLSLESQFRQALKNKELANALLTHRFNRTKCQPDSKDDIFDGLQYKKFFDNGGLLSNPHNFSYSFNTDGVKAGNSCSVNRTMWPLYVTINEIPLKLRNKYVFLAGLYVGKHHPYMNSFLVPFIEQANKLSSQGMTWCSHTGQTVVSKVIPLCAVVDSPARSSMLQMNSSTSQFGCTFCYQQTQYSVKGRRFSGRRKGDDRTHESSVADMDVADRKQSQKLPEKMKRHNGFWQSSVLRELNYFHLVKGFVPEYMHALLLGAVRQHTELLLDPQHKKKFWINMTDDIGIEHLKTLMDTYLRAITPPQCITRLIRPLSEMDNWKASEWRLWLVFYFIVCCKNELKPKYLNHFAMLAVAANILLQKSISSRELDEAEVLILKYVFFFEEYFGDTSMNYCIHLLTHIVAGARNYGPLFTHNAFVYEGQNRYLLQMLKSPYKVVKQLTTKYMIFSSLPDLCTKLATCEDTGDFCENLIGQRLKRFVHTGGTVLIGNGSIFEPSEDEIYCLNLDGFPTEGGKSFGRFVWNGARYCTKAVAFEKRNNDSIFVANDGRFCIVENIVSYPNDCVLLFVREILVDRLPIILEEDVTVTHIVSTQLVFSELFILRPRDIECHCLIMYLPHGTFLAKIPHGCLGD